MTSASDAVTPTTLGAGGTNAVGRILGLLGDEWTLLIVQQALLGATRYGEFIERLPISNTVLTNRLRTLTRRRTAGSHDLPNPARSRRVSDQPARTGPLAGAVVDLGVGTTLGARACSPAAGDAPHGVRQRLCAGADLPIVHRSGDRERRSPPAGVRAGRGRVQCPRRSPVAERAPTVNAIRRGYFPRP